jgi:uncharacterized protein YndB with AHSA1/START domain
VKAAAVRELLAPRADVWRFLAEPYHLSDWWPGIAGVEPDRRGLAPGARWQVHGSSAPALLRRPRATGLLLVRRVDPPRLLAWHLTWDRLDVEIALEAVAEDRTRATLTVESPVLLSYRRALPRRALERLYALCQTAATP